MIEQGSDPDLRMLFRLRAPLRRTGPTHHYTTALGTRHRDRMAFGGTRRRRPCGGWLSCEGPVVQPLIRRAMSALRLSLLLPLIVLASVSRGQASTTEGVPDGGGGPAARTDNMRRWTIGLGTGVGMGYRMLFRTGPSDWDDAIIRARDELEEPRIALGGHVGAGYHLSRRIGLDAGIGYTQIGWQEPLSYEGFIFRDPNDHEIPARGTFIYVLHYLDLRLGATLTLGQGRWRSISALGMAPALLIAARTRIRSEYSDGRLTHTSREPMERFNTFNLFPYFSTGVAFHPGGRWEWRLQPSVRYGAMRITNGSVAANVFSGTVDFGVWFTL